jgi:hypothetical protein
LAERVPDRNVPQMTFAPFGALPVTLMTTWPALLPLLLRAAALPELSATPTTRSSASVIEIRRMPSILQELRNPASRSGIPPGARGERNLAASLAP